MSTLAQRSFASGEISPALWGRSDQAKYATGLTKCRNFMVMKYGGLSNRPATTFVCEVKDSTKTVRFIPFVFNTAQTYVLEFGDFYMRLEHNGGQVLEATKAITGATQANPCVLTVVAHGYATGDEVAIAGILGMTQLNGRNFKVVVLTADTFSLKYMDGSAVNSTAFTAYSSAGTAARVYTIVSPYAYADLPLLKFAESADVITITHPSYPIQELSRLADTNWTIAAVTLAPKIAQPNGGAASGAGVSSAQKWRVTAVDAKTQEESLPGFEASTPITGASQANPVSITDVGHNYLTGDEVYISNVGGMVQLNGRRFRITKTGANTFTLQDPSTGVNVDGTGYTAWTAGGTVERTWLSGLNMPATLITIPTAAGVLQYNVYFESNGIFGFHGSVAPTPGVTSYNISGYTMDLTDTPPYGTNPFPGAGDYPSCVGFMQQRRAFGGTNNAPEQVTASKTGSFKNFDKSIPTKAGDSLSFILASQKVNAIKHIMELGAPIIFTQSGEWALLGGADGSITPTSLNAKIHSYFGASDLAPIVVDATAIFVQSRGNKVRDLAFDWQVNGYRGNDLSIFSAHLVDGYTIVDWTYAQVPNSILWMVRSDGVLLGLTYIREQQLWAWHRHDFDGFVENVCAVPEGVEDALYLVIRRTINGATKRYVERFSTRQVTSIIDYIGVDCALSFDGRNLDLTKTMTLTGGTLWNDGEALTLTSSSSQFKAADVGNAIFLTSPDGLTIVRCRIDSFTSATIVTVFVDKNVPVAMRGVALGVWSKALLSVTGLWHLEGKKVSVLADGFVVANPNNPDYDVLTVASGSLTFKRPYAVIHAGLPFVSDFETLDIDLPGSESIADKKKNVGKVTLFLQDSRGVWVGPADPGSDISLAGLEEMRIRGLADESPEQPVALRTGKIEIPLQPDWDSQGHIFVRQTDPLPLTVLAAMPSGNFPLNQGAQR